MTSILFEGLEIGFTTQNQSKFDYSMASEMETLNGNLFNTAYHAPGQQNHARETPRHLKTSQELPIDAPKRPHDGSRTPPRRAEDASPDAPPTPRWAKRPPGAAQHFSRPRFWSVSSCPAPLRTSFWGHFVNDFRAPSEPCVLKTFLNRFCTNFFSALNTNLLI